MLEIVGTEASSSSNGSTTASRTIKKELGKDDFLMLLTKQLQQQDPMKPLENTEFIAQMAQFSALEQTANLNENFKSFMNSQNDFYRLQSLQLIGMSVKGVKESEVPGTEPLQVEGIVESVTIQDGLAMLKVGDQTLTISELTSVGFDPVQNVANGAIKR